MNSRFTQKISLSPDALAQELSGETVILDLPSESYFGLNEVGTRVWQLIQEHNELQKVFEIMLEEFEVEPEKLEQDISNFCEDLVKSGLVLLDDQKTH